VREREKDRNGNGKERKRISDGQPIHFPSSPFHRVQPPKGTHTHTEREREREEGPPCGHSDTLITLCQQRERRERATAESPFRPFPSSSSFHHVCASYARRCASGGV
jgi:hypothetical protein